MSVVFNNLKVNSYVFTSNKTVLIMIVSLSLLLSGCKGYLNNTYKVPQSTVVTFFNMLSTGEVSQAYEDLFKKPLIANGPDEFEKLRQAKNYLKTKTRDSLRIYGKPVSFENIKTDSIGSKTVRLIYILNQVKRPTLWEFEFYLSDNKWHLIGMFIHDQPKTYAGIIGAND